MCVIKEIVCGEFRTEDWLILDLWVRQGLLTLLQTRCMKDLRHCIVHISSPFIVLSDTI
jgi:hypothetical protein